MGYKNSAKKLFKKLSAVRATLPDDECTVLDALVLGELVLTLDPPVTKLAEPASGADTLKLHVSYDQQQETYIIE